MGGLKEQIAYDGKLFVAVASLGCDGREQGVFIELNGKFFCTFFSFRLRCFDLVFAVEVAADPIKARSSSFVDD